VAVRITRFSTGNLELMQAVRSDARIYEDSSEGAEIRARVGRALYESMKREWFSLNMHLGNRYVDSRICVYDEPESREQIEAEYQEGGHYVPTTRPGCRAPHAWLADGRSTLDLYGRGYVLLCLSSDANEASGLLEAARAVAMPLECIRLTDPEIERLYARKLVLVRPDGHVAWRGNAAPKDPDALIRVVAGRSAVH
jgi:hypothetical protein